MRRPSAAVTQPQRTLRLVDASALLVNACQTLGLSALLESTPCEEVCA